MALAVTATTTTATSFHDRPDFSGDGAPARRLAADLQLISVDTPSATLARFEDAIRARTARSRVEMADNNVNRAGKSDLQITRNARVGFRNGIPSAGQVFDLKSIFSNQTDDKALPRVSFAIPDADFRSTLVAFSSFVPSADPASDAPVRVARASIGTPPASIPWVASAKTAGAPVVLAKGDRPAAILAKADAEAPVLAYANPESEIQAPFSAVMRGSDEAASANGVAVPLDRPDKTVLTAWLDGRSMAQFDPNYHDWTSTVLPASVHEPEEQACLARGVYFEARGESEEGQAAVAQVILNRVKNPAYPNTICEVVYQNAEWRDHCQFSFACDGDRKRIYDFGAWQTAQRVAEEVTDGKTWIADVGDSTHYHAVYVKPRWARTMEKMDKIGRHVFYRTLGGGWS
ncbi:cell wall hydrolase [Faunimonas pinastri]|nr:cell wall hydrolase [Faunimonas pinastri]